MTLKHGLPILLGSLVLCAACLPFPNLHPMLCLKINHDLISNPYGEQLWSVQDIYAYGPYDGTLLASGPGRLFVVANSPSYPGPHLLSYDTLTGSLLSQRLVDLPILLFLSDGKLYVGQHDEIGVFDSMTGSLLEEFSIPKAGIIESLYQRGDKFYIYGNTGRFIVFDTSVMKTVTTTEPNFLEHVFLIDDNITYSHKGNELIAFNGSSGAVVWQAEMNEPFTDPVFQNDMIFIRTGSSIYTSGISAINRSTGVVVWKKDLNIIISNVVAQNSELYFLTVDGFLIVLDQQTGQEIGKMQFTSAPFLLNDTQYAIGGYYVSADTDNKIIIVSLGDSCQLFGVKLQKE